MRNLILSFLISMVFIGAAFAIPNAKVVPLAVSGTAITSYALTSGVAVNSDAVDVEDNIGFATLVVTENAGGGTGDVDIYAEYSYDGTTWARYYASDMAGSITVEGNIVTTLQNVTRYIGFTVRLAPYIRIVFDPDANSTVTARLIFQRER